jgi:hypothetical protein
MTTRLARWAGVLCLVVGPTALLGQALLSPVSVGGDPADQVAEAAAQWPATASSTPGRQRRRRLLAGHGRACSLWTC